VPWARCRCWAPGDRINGTHRAHHQVLLKLVNCRHAARLRRLNDAFTPEMDEAIHRFMAEIMGLTPGYCGGRGGSMHMRQAAAGIMGTSAIVGGNPPHAVGYALADKMLGRDTGLGRVLRRWRGAERRQLRGDEHRRRARAAHHLLHREQPLRRLDPHHRHHPRNADFLARGDAGHPLDRGRRDGCGRRPRAMAEARRIIASEGGPVVVEALLYRHFHQSGSRKGSDFGYRPLAEEEEWLARDPVKTAAQRLRRWDITSAEGSGPHRPLVTGRVAAAAAQLTETVPGRQRAAHPRQALARSRDADDHGILGDLSELTTPACWITIDMAGVKPSG
jgi:2-oxoisovalerate dehydrogenase E1 component